MCAATSVLPDPTTPRSTNVSTVGSLTAWTASICFGLSWSILRISWSDSAHVDSRCFEAFPARGVVVVMPVAPAIVVLQPEDPRRSRGSPFIKRRSTSAAIRRFAPFYSGGKRRARFVNILSFEVVHSRTRSRSVHPVSFRGRRPARSPCTARDQ